MPNPKQRRVSETDEHQPRQFFLYTSSAFPLHETDNS